MANYPQWQPGAAKPNDRLLIFEDTDNDGMADKCKTFYDKLICPTGFEFWNGGVLVVDEPRILFIKDTDGDDQADLVEANRSTASRPMTRTIPWVPGNFPTAVSCTCSKAFRFRRPWKLLGVRSATRAPAALTSLIRTRCEFQHYRTPGYGNPWCLVFDPGAMASSATAPTPNNTGSVRWRAKKSTQRKTLTPVFDNEGMRPAVGNEFLLSRHLPDDMQGQFIYACVINMHGMPRFNVTTTNQPEQALKASGSMICSHRPT